MVISNLAEDDPNINDDIISNGQPEGQNNAITFGIITLYEKVSLKEPNPLSFDVVFNVIKHTARVAPGSSGGVLLNPYFKIVGINYAGASNTTFADSNYGYSIPVSKIREYLNLYIYKKSTDK